MVFRAIVLALLVGGVCGEKGALPPRVVRLRDQVQGARNRTEQRTALKRLFDVASASDLRTLSRSRYPSVSLHAYWRLVRQDDLALKRETDIQCCCSQEAAARFAGFIEGRTAERVPAAWEQALWSVKALDARWERSGDSAFLSSEPASMSLARGLRLAHDEKGWRLVIGDTRVRLPAEVVEHIESPWTELGEAQGAVAGSRVLLVLTDGLGFDGTLFCVDRTSGSLAWSAKLWCLGPRTGWLYTGPWHNFTWVTAEADKRVSVYGIATQGAYLESFEMQSGACLGRFSTLRRPWQDNEEAAKLPELPHSGPADPLPD